MKDEGEKGGDGRCVVAFPSLISAGKSDFWTLVLVVLTETFHLWFPSCQSLGHLLEGLAI